MNSHFFRNIGIAVLCLLLAAAGADAFGSSSVQTSSRIQNKKLPIYCVSSGAPKVSISFDAAWGNGSLR